MKKYLLTPLTIILLLVTFNSIAQYQTGQVDLNIGVGLGNIVAGSGSTSAIAPISASLEYGVTDNIGLSAYLGYTGASYSYTGSYISPTLGPTGYIDTYKWSFLILGARGAYHLGNIVKVEKLDLYGGLMLGYNIANSSFSSTDGSRANITYGGSSFGGFIWSLYAGGRYRFNDKVGVFGELGYGIAYLTVGVNFKF